MVIIDQFSKYATFILPLVDCKVDKATHLSLNNIVKLDCPTEHH